MARWRKRVYVRTTTVADAVEALMVVRRSRPLLLAVLVASTVGALVFGVSAAAAATAGDLADVKRCQQGGWRDLVTSEGAGLTSLGGLRPLRRPAVDALSQRCLT